MGKGIIKIGQHSFGLPPLIGPYCNNALALCFALDLIAICNNGGVWSSHDVWSANDALFLINLSPPLSGPGVEVGLTPNIMKGINIFIINVINIFHVIMTE